MSIRSFLRRRPAPCAGELTGYTTGVTSARGATRRACAAGPVRAAAAATVETLEGRLFLSTTPDPTDGGPADTTPPTATLSAADVSAPGATSTTVTVHYQDDVGINPATIDASDLTVAGPGGAAVSV